MHAPVLDVGQGVQPGEVDRQVGGREEEAAEEAADLERDREDDDRQVRGLLREMT